MLKRILSILYAFLCVVVCVYAIPQKEVVGKRGLYFNTFNGSQGLRTTLDLNDGQAFGLSEPLTVDFDLLLRRDNAPFGTILNIVPDKGSVIHLSVIVEKDSPVLVAIRDEQIMHIAKMDINRWLHFSLTFNATVKNLFLTMDRYEKEISLPTGSTSAKLVFGFDEKFSRDVPPINLRNIMVKSGDKLIRHWELEKHNDSICYDKVARSKAVAHNGRWLIDTHVNLLQVFSRHYDALTEVVVNPKNGYVYLIGEKEIEYLDVYGKSLGKFAVSGESPKFSLGSSVVSMRDLSLMAYSINNKGVSVFDFANRLWSNSGACDGDNSYYNHARAWSERDSSYYFFGGYGHFLYNNELYRMNVMTHEISRLSYQPAISPRYSAAAVVSGRDLYILGGRGNTSGQQSLTSYSYYDLYKIDLDKGMVKQLWAMPDTLNDTPRFTLSSSMYFDEAGKAFYVGNLYKGKLSLLKLSPDKPGWTVVAEIPVDDEGIQLMDLSLYYCPELQRILLVLNRQVAESSFKVDIYSIATPILTEKDVRQFEDVGLTVACDKWLVYLGLLGVLLLLGCGTVYAFRRRKQKPVVDATKSSAVNDAIASEPIVEQPVETGQTEEEEIAPVILPASQLQHRSFIQLLGEFRIIDRHGNDITSSCTPKQKEMLLIIIFFCEKERSGRIPAERISDMLWPDKEGLSARNNRNVSLRKLRTFLAEVGDIDILGKDRFISITWNDVVCDYHKVMVEAKQMGHGNMALHEVDNSTLSYLFSGTLLPDVSYLWLDDFKSEFSMLSLDYLEGLLIEQMRAQYDDAVLKIAEVMLRHDPFNENALAAKCQILVKRDKRGVAKNVYQSFCREYEKSFAEPFDYSFSDLLDSVHKKFS